jgi:hypothetical protein
MQRIVVNGVEEVTIAALEHWGELLDYLDRHVADDGKVLTAIRFDGVDQPSFRDPEAAGRPVGPLTVIEAESMSPGALLDNSIDEAIAASRALASGAERVGDAFRGFDVTRANQDLQELAQGVGTLVAIAQALSQAVGVGLEAVTCGGKSANDMVEALSSQVHELIVAREAGDWITVADTIEYDLAPSLHLWPGVFETLRQSVRH